MPSSGGSEITKAMILAALTRIGSPSLAGKGLIISTGWFKHWFETDYLSDGPFFSADVMEFMVESKVSLLGSDMPCWDSPTYPTGHLLTYFKSDGLMLAPLYDTDRLSEGAGQLIAIPLPIENTSASPVRAVWVA
jgi:kynurenine formamidase